MLRVSDVGYVAETKRQKARRLHEPIAPTSPSGQDYGLTNLRHSSFAVADGVGSSSGAEIAAQMVCETYIDLVQNLYDRLPADEQTEREHSRAILSKLHTAALGSLATTTFTGMVVHRYGAMSYLHAGDSQLLLSRGNRLIHCTSEHVKPSGHELLNYLGTQPEWSRMGLVRPVLELTKVANSFSETKLEAEWGTLPLQHGDRLALVTDGITGSGVFDRLDDEVLQALMDRRRIVGAQACADLLLRASRKIDDTTAIVVDISGHRTRWLE